MKVDRRTFVGGVIATVISPKVPTKGKLTDGFTSYIDFGKEMLLCEDETGRIWRDCIEVTPNKEIWHQRYPKSNWCLSHDTERMKHTVADMTAGPLAGLGDDCSPQWMFRPAFQVMSSCQGISYRVKDPYMNEDDFSDFLMWLGVKSLPPIGSPWYFDREIK